jgi:hypothetical protein
MGLRKVYWPTLRVLVAAMHIYIVQNWAKLPAEITTEATMTALKTAVTNAQVFLDNYDLTHPRGTLG